MYSRSYSYAGGSYLPTGHTTSIGSESFDLSVHYDGYFARPKSVVYPYRDDQGNAVFATYLQYNLQGFVTLEGNSLDYDDVNPGSSASYRKVLNRSPRGTLLKAQLGNNLYDHVGEYPATGQIAESLVSANSAGTSPLLDYSYEYDRWGNLANQSSTLESRRETFSFDRLHRLRENQRYDISGATPQLLADGSVSYSYDVLGNITQKTDYAQDYQYGLDGAGLACTGSSAAPGPNAVTETDSETFGYDANGNLICGSRDNLGIVYDPLNQVRSISSDLGQSSFDYAPDGSRYRQVSESQETLYIAKAYERIDDREHKLYVGDYLVITYGGEQAQINYLHKDRLGSVVGISNTASAFSSTRGFNPYGDPRGGEWSENNQDLDGDELTTRGFTGHEHLERLGLIHMNGRIFNPGLGRFLSPDPIIQFPLNGQSWNAYSYLLNNPMSGTDPSGFTGEFDDDDDGRRIACGFICGPPIGVYGNTSAWFDQVYFDFPSFVENENRIGRDGLGNFVVSDIGNQAISELDRTIEWITSDSQLSENVAQIINNEAIRAGTLAVQYRSSVSVGDDSAGDPLQFTYTRRTGDIILQFDQNGELTGLLNVNGQAVPVYPEFLVLPAGSGALRLGHVLLGRIGSKVAPSIIPARLARVVDARFVNSIRLGGPSADDVFVVAADDIAGITSATDLARRLTLLDDAGQLRAGPFAVIEFNNPAAGLAVPVFRSNPGFLQGGLTRGGAREFVLPNTPLKDLAGVVIRIVE